MGDNLFTGPLKDSELAEAFERARILIQPIPSDYQRYPGLREPTLFIASPVFRSGTIAGIIVIQLRNREFYQIFSKDNGLGNTGETMVAILEGEEVRFVTPLRYDPDAAFRRRVRLGTDRSTAMQKAVQGGQGYGEAIDYRGVPVMAAWTYLPSFTWGLQVKQDRGEAFALIGQQRLAVAILLGLTGILVLLAAILLARAIAGPLRGTATVARRIASDHLTARVADYRTSTIEAAAAVNEISATSQELLRTMNEVNQVARQTAAMATTGQESLAGMDRTMRQLAESTGSIGSKLSVISERAANINLVVTTITKVADQTNLLSINAAIEAEKAGEYGLGFLVVAREIRRLADQTAVATLDIERMVKEMQYSVSAGVMEMDKFSEQVRQVVSEVQHIGGQLGQIIAGVQGLDQRFDQVTEGMRVQSQGAEQIREAMTMINDVANKTSESLHELNAAIDRLGEVVGYKEGHGRIHPGGFGQDRPAPDRSDPDSLRDRAMGSGTLRRRVMAVMLLLTFRAAESLYAVDVARVVEVVPRIDLRRLPHAPAFLAGVFDYRGVVVPVVDLGILLGSDACADRLSTRIILVDSQPGGRNPRASDRGIATMTPERTRETLTAPARRAARGPAAGCSV